MAFLVSITLAGPAVRAQPQPPPLRYQFKGITEAVYEVTIRGETPDSIETRSGHIIYTIKSTDPAGGRTAFTYSAELNENKQSKQPEERTWPPRPPRPPMFSPPFPFGPTRASAEIVIDARGNVIRSNRMDDESQLPYMLGYAWQLLLQPLPENNQNTWNTQRQITIYTKKQGQSWPPAPPWARQEEDRTDRSAQETVTYTRGQTNGSLVTVQRKYELHLEEQTGGVPALKQTGDGQVVFDTSSGVVQSLDWKLTIEANENNMSVRIPVTVKAKLLTAEEYAKFQEDAKAAAEKNKARIEEFQARRAKAVEEQQKDLSDVPDGATKSILAGGPGGRPFVRVDPDDRPVIGLRYTLGSWAGRSCIRQIDPVYEKPSEDEQQSNEGKYLLARDGYAIGGMLVNLDGTDVIAAQAIYMRMTDGQLVRTDTYRSAWICKPNKKPSKLLGGKGETVIGFYGRQGMNTDAIGLILKDPAATQEASADADASSDKDASSNKKAAAGKEESSDDQASTAEDSPPLKKPGVPKRPSLRRPPAFRPRPAEEQ